MHTGLAKSRLAQYGPSSARFCHVDLQVIFDRNLLGGATLYVRALSHVRLTVAESRGPMHATQKLVSKVMKHERDPLLCNSGAAL